MGKLKIFLIFIALLINSALLAYSSDPKEFVGELVNDAINKLSKNHNIYPTYCIDKFSI